MLKQYRSITGILIQWHGFSMIFNYLMPESTGLIGLWGFRHSYVPKGLRSECGGKLPVIRIPFCARGTRIVRKLAGDMMTSDPTGHRVWGAVAVQCTQGSWLVVKRWNAKLEGLPSRTGARTGRRHYPKKFQKHRPALVSHWFFSIGQCISR